MGGGSTAAALPLKRGFSENDSKNKKGVLLNTFSLKVKQNGSKIEFAYFEN